MQTYLHRPAITILLAGIFVFSGCSGDFDSGMGFSLAQQPELEIGVSGSDVPGDEPYVGIRHKDKPECLFGTVLPFMDITPEEYFKKVSNEVSAQRGIPFLEKTPKLETQGKVLFASVSAYDEALKKYVPSYAAAFRAKDKLWIAWIQLKCPEPVYNQLARKVITSLRPHR